MGPPHAFHFIGSLTLILFLAVMVKVFPYDFVVLAPEAPPVVIITLGLLMIGATAAYPKLQI